MPAVAWQCGLLCRIQTQLGAWGPACTLRIETAIEDATKCQNDTVSSTHHQGLSRDSPGADSRTIRTKDDWLFIIWQMCLLVFAAVLCWSMSCSLEDGLSAKLCKFVVGLSQRT